jgi:hypothetical protein
VHDARFRGKWARMARRHAAEKARGGLPGRERAASGVQMKAPAPLHVPSTIPPPPFTREVEVGAHEWWLGEHIQLASRIQGVDQQLAGLPDDAATAAAVTVVRSALDILVETRDALYDVYCDAADRRMRPMASPAGPLATYIGGLYLFAEQAVTSLVHLVTGLKAGRPEWGEARRGFADAALGFERTSGPVLDEIERDLFLLPIDFASPVEPLRNARKDAQAMFRAAARLEACIGRLFG